MQVWNRLKGTGYKPVYEHILQFRQNVLKGILCLYEPNAFFSILYKLFRKATFWMLHRTYLAQAHSKHALTDIILLKTSRITIGRIPGFLSRAINPKALHVDITNRVDITRKKFWRPALTARMMVRAADSSELIPDGSWLMCFQDRQLDRWCSGCRK